MESRLDTQRSLSAFRGTLTDHVRNYSANAARAQPLEPFGGPRRGHREGRAPGCARNRQPELRERAAEAADIVVRRLAEPVPDTAGRRRAGLLRGASGAALFLLRQYEGSGDREQLAAGAALRRDLACCAERESGAVEVDEGWRTLPHLGDGSAGVGMVLDDLVSHVPDAGAEFARARAGIRTAAASRFYAQPGLFQGRAGMILYLARTTEPGATRARLDEQIAALGWLAMPYQGRLAFPGHQGRRLPAGPFAVRVGPAQGRFGAGHPRGTGARRWSPCPSRRPARPRRPYGRRSGSRCSPSR